ncbi:MAG: PQQ-dependent sugar dehydrogenase [Bacteroidetes bacterium]|nr:PQQ-dependent sugar dehydrogenase [Bacteroidota bacterium]
MRIVKLVLIFSFILSLIAKDGAAQTVVPSGFNDVLFCSGLTNVTGFTFDSNGRCYAWEKVGKIWIIDSNGVKQNSPLLDISQEVGNWNEHGLIGFVLDPQFYQNGFFYLYYTVDRHHLLYFGTGTYNTNTNWHNAATIIRVTRYKADVSTNYTTTLPGSRFVLIGENKTKGIPVSTGFHTGGSLMFGNDGSLLIAVGDNSLASGGNADTGSYSGTYWSQALADTILNSFENIGAFRSQLVQSLSGKILRIDPSTGDGLSTNPYYNAAQPRAAESRIWAMGLRNPFRCFVIPGTGSTDITAGEPGDIVINDVGYNKREEVNICSEDGANFGWPLYEGYDTYPSYYNATTRNLTEPNPLSGGNCPSHFMFKSLLIEDTKNPIPQWQNPCDTNVQIPAAAKRQMHHRPVFDYRHAIAGVRIGSFDGNNAITLNVGDTNCTVTGTPFAGECIAGSIFYNRYDFPIQYQGKLFALDYDNKWIKCFEINNQYELVSFSNFATSTYPLLSIATNPAKGGIYYINYGGQIRRIFYTLNVNNPPQAQATVNTSYGNAPLTLNFDANNTIDPDDNPITYQWLWGDGNSSSGITATYTFTDTSNIPSRIDVRLVATDLSGLSDTVVVPIYLNCLPSAITITSIADSDYYSTNVQTLLPLQATVTDNYFSYHQLKYEWVTALYHNNHSHPEEADTNKITQSLIGPAGCGENYFYKLMLTVTNPLGLKSSTSLNLLPECFTPSASFNVSADSICNGDTVLFTNTSKGTGLTFQWIFEDGTPATSTNKNPVVRFNSYGFKKVQLKISNYLGVDSITISNAVFVNAPLPAIVQGNQASICKNNGTITLNATISNALGYQWLINNQVLMGYTQPNATINIAGNYSVVITDTLGCSDTSSAITINYYNNIDTGIISTPSDGLFCNGTSCMLTSKSDSNFTFQWYKKDSPLTGVTGYKSVFTTGGVYKVLITDFNGCTEYSRNRVISAEPRIDLYFNGITKLCEGDSMLLSAHYSADYTYQWIKNGNNISGATLSNYFSKQPGKYKVRVTSTLGCTRTSAVVKISSTECYGIKLSELYPFISGIYPNPASQQVFIEFEHDKAEPVYAEIYSSIGLLVYTSDKIISEEGYNYLQVDINKMEQGVYFVYLRGLYKNTQRKFILKR